MSDDYAAEIAALEESLMDETRTSRRLIEAMRYITGLAENIADAETLEEARAIGEDIYRTIDNTMDALGIWK